MVSEPLARAGKTILQADFGLPTKTCKLVRVEQLPQRSIGLEQSVTICPWKLTER
jgi:hypothetical protein